MFVWAMHNPGGGAVYIQLQFRKVEEIQRAAAFDKPEVIALIQNSEREITHNILSHTAKAVKAQDFLSLNELYSDIAVGFNFSVRKMLRTTQLLVVVQHAVVSKGKVRSGVAPERMIVVVKFLIALCGKACVPPSL